MSTNFRIIYVESAVSYDDIFLFIKLINVGTFSGLAKVLNTTQGTISRKIQQLEGDLRLQLIKRNSRGLFEMTPDGEILYNKFSGQEENLNNALEDVINRQNIIKGTLKVALPMLLYNTLLVPYIHEFHKSYPDAKLIISYSTGQPIDVLKENIDLAISPHRPTVQNVKIRLLKKAHSKLYATNEYIQKYGAPEYLEDLAKHQIVGTAINNVPNNCWEVTELNSGNQILINHESSIYISALHNTAMALSDNYIIKAIDFFMQKNLDNGEIQEILPNYSFGTNNFYLIRSNGIQSKLERVFIEFIESCLNGDLE